MMSAFFRANVGACITDGAGKVLACRRRGSSDGAWQMPQGGLELGEDAEHALWRELGEEVGLGPENLVLIRAHPDWLAYELPEDYRSAKTGMGQVQRWFLLNGSPNCPVQLDGKEFDQWQWTEPPFLLHSAIAFRKGSYVKVLSEFGLLQHHRHKP